MANRDELLVRVRSVLVETFELEPNDIQPQTHLYHDLDLDSLDAIDLAVKLSSETGIKLKEEEMKAIRTVDDILDTVIRRLNPATSM